MRTARSLIQISIILLSCAPKKESNTSIPFRDAIMKDYFSLLRSAPIRDTLREDHILLKAYFKNDTAYLGERYRDLQVNFEKAREKPGSLACEDASLLHLQGFDEAYRFYYTAAFCDTIINITISKKGSLFRVDVLTHALEFPNGKCRTIIKSSRNIEQWKWDTFQKHLYYLDFWGMAERNGIEGMDGSSLTAYGYKKIFGGREPFLKGVYRWSAEQTALGDLFKMLLDYSGTKSECFGYYSKQR